MKAKRQYLAGNTVNLSCETDAKIWRQFKSIYGFLGKTKQESIEESLKLYIDKHKSEIINV